MENLSPIILFVYNRPEHTRRTIESLLNCKYASQSNLYVFSDAPKNETAKTKVAEVRKFIHSIDGFNKIIIEENKENKGLAESVISGVSKVLQNHESVIVLEDDLVFSPNFLDFMNKALNKFKDDESVFTVSGYSFPIKVPKDYDKDIYLGYRSSSWGWATWKYKWNKAVWEKSYFSKIIEDSHLKGKFNRAGNDYSPMLIKQLKGVIDSWAIRWAFNQSMTNAYTLFPRKSLVKNIGLDGSGTHSKKRKKYVVELNDFNPALEFDSKLEINEEINNRIKNLNSLSIYRRIRNFISYGIF